MSEAAVQGDLLETLAGMEDDEVRDLIDSETTARDLRRAFERFHEANPGVYEALVHLARELKDEGHTRIGISLIWEVLRWKILRGDTRTTDGYKLANQHRAFYARLIMRQEPDLQEFFETRRSIADH